MFTCLFYNSTRRASGSDHLFFLLSFLLSFMYIKLQSSLRHQGCRVSRIVPEPLRVVMLSRRKDGGTPEGQADDFGMCIDRLEGSYLRLEG